MSYWIIKPPYIEGNGTNSHIFKDKSKISFCGIEHKQGAKGIQKTTLADLKIFIKNSGRELCAKCSGSVAHTDL